VKKIQISRQKNGPTFLAEILNRHWLFFSGQQNGDRISCFWWSFQFKWQVFAFL